MTLVVKFFALRPPLLHDKKRAMNLESLATTPRLAQQIAFILEMDKLKSVLRRSYLVNETRHENSAEHSWHLAVMALVFAERANEPVNSERVLKMLLVHDIVEIDAGDTFCYDTVGVGDQAARENLAAERIFDLLPPEQGAELRALWQEFEARSTPEARFAAALDRLMPLLHNFATEGKSWREHGVTAAQVVARNGNMDEGSHELWAVAKALIAEAVARGYLPAV